MKSQSRLLKISNSLNYILQSIHPELPFPNFKKEVKMTTATHKATTITTTTSPFSVPTTRMKPSLSRAALVSGAGAMTTEVRGLTKYKKKNQQTIFLETFPDYPSFEGGYIMWIKHLIYLTRVRIKKKHQKKNNNI